MNVCMNLYDKYITPITLVDPDIVIINTVRIYFTLFNWVLLFII